MSALSSLVTQVSEEDDKKKAAPTPAPVPQARPAAEQKRRSCWSIFCCCCAKTADDEPPPPQGPEVKVPGPAPGGGGGGGGGDRKVDPPPKPADPVPGPAPTPGPASGPGSEPPQEEPKWLLDPFSDEEKKMNKKTLVLDLDETLVHSSFTYIPDADFVIEIELDGAIYKVYVRKRPGVDEFMREVGKKFEVVIFTASLAKYADPLLDILDKDRIVKKRLFREACVQHYGNYVKDLSLLGRKLEHSIIIDNSPFSYMFQPDNAIPITSWFNDKSDRQLLELLPFLDSLLEVDDVTTLLSQKSA